MKQEIRSPSVRLFRKLLAAIAVVVALTGAGVTAAQTAQAATLVVTENGTVASGASRVVGAAWGSSGPYKVNFNCGISGAGCSNFVTDSTASTTYFQTIVVSTCTGKSVSTKTTIWESQGRGASAAGTTVSTWARGTICRTN